MYTHSNDTDALKKWLPFSKKKKERERNHHLTFVNRGSTSGIELDKFYSLLEISSYQAVPFLSLL